MIFSHYNDNENLVKAKVYLFLFIGVPPGGGYGDQGGLLFFVKFQISENV